MSKILYYAPSEKTKQFNETNLELFTKLRNGDEEVRDQIILFNNGLAKRTAMRYRSDVIPYDEAYSLCLIGLLKAVDSYSLEKNVKFASYASTVMVNEIFMENRKAKNKRNNVSMYEVFYESGDGSDITLEQMIPNGDEPIEQIIENQEIVEYIKEFSHQLPDKYKMIFDEILINESGQHELGEKLGLSQSYISRLYKSMVVELRKEIIKKGFVEKDIIPDHVAAVRRKATTNSVNKHKPALKKERLKSSSIKYVFLTYPDLSNIQISQALGLSSDSIERARWALNRGELNRHVPTPEYKERLDLYIDSHRDELIPLPVTISSIYDLPSEERAKYI